VNVVLAQEEADGEDASPFPSGSGVYDEVRTVVRIWFFCPIIRSRSMLLVVQLYNLLIGQYKLLAVPNVIYNVLKTD